MHSLDNSNVFQLEKRDPDGSCSVVRVKNVALDLKGVAYSTTQSLLAAVVVSAASATLAFARFVAAVSVTTDF